MAHQTSQPARGRPGLPLPPSRQPAGRTPSLGDLARGPQELPSADPGLTSQWMQFLQKPEVRTALLQFGITLLQPKQPGETAVSRIGAGVGAAGRAVERFTETRTEREAAATGSRREEERLDLERRRTVVAERRPESAIAVLQREVLAGKVPQAALDLALQGNKGEAERMIAGLPENLRLQFTLARLEFLTSREPTTLQQKIELGIASGLSPEDAQAAALGLIKSVTDPDTKEVSFVNGITGRTVSFAPTARGAAGQPPGAVQPPIAAQPPGAAPPSAVETGRTSRITANLENITGLRGFTISTFDDIVTALGVRPAAPQALQASKDLDALNLETAVNIRKDVAGITIPAPILKRLDKILAEPNAVFTSEADAAASFIATRDLIGDKLNVVLEALESEKLSPIKRQDLQGDARTLQGLFDAYDLLTEKLQAPLSRFTSVEDVDNATEEALRALIRSHTDEELLALPPGVLARAIARLEEFNAGAQR